MQTVAKIRLRRTLVWAARIIVGFTFIISGWAKSIDPWGFLIKVNEYLTVWGLTVPREAVLTACVGLACVEFCTGAMIAGGSFKRTATWIAAAMMAVMLPLTVYIAVANPVSDCGCFGDFWVISNGATLAKNIVITALIIYLICVNHTVGGIYPAPIQWMEVTFSLAFPLVIAFIGYHVQPLVDFRPYKIGTRIFDENMTADSEKYIYEKDGQEEAFPLDAIPDSTWTFVRVEESGQPAAERGFEVRDADDYDVSYEIASEKGPVLNCRRRRRDAQQMGRPVPPPIPGILRRGHGPETACPRRCRSRIQRRRHNTVETVAQLDGPGNSGQKRSAERTCRHPAGRRRKNTYIHCVGLRSPDAHHLSARTLAAHPAFLRQCNPQGNCEKMITGKKLQL